MGSQPYAGGQAYGSPSTTGGYPARGYDPCASAPVAGNVFGLLASAMTQQQRDRQCAAHRQAQWADYTARQKAAKDKEDAAAAQAKAQEEAAAQAKQAQADRTTAQQASAHARRQAAAIRERRVAASARQAARDEQTSQRSRAIALVRAEQAPNNFCRDPKLARGVMEGWNDLDSFKSAGVKVIDIEHVSTGFFHAGDRSFACHGVFVTNRGWRVAGTATVKHNIVGDPMFVWTRDADQDISAYAAAPVLDAGSPEMASQTKLGAGGLTQTASDREGGP